MSTILAAIKGKSGNTDYFICSMKARRLAAETTGVGSKIRQDINSDNIVKYIAPYLAEDNDRFFGSVIVSATGKWTFTPFGNFLGKDAAHPLYKPFMNRLNNMGILSIPDSSVWHLLDGQHRVMAIKCAIEGKVAKGQNVAHFSANANLSDEDVSVILIPHDSQNDSPELAPCKEDIHGQQTAN